MELNHKYIHIDIIIPAYNAQKTIDLTLKSIDSQTYKAVVKVYIINDGSEVDYSDFVKKYSSSFFIKEIIIKKNKGLGLARQCGIDNSNSEYLMFIDADDCFYDRYVIEKIYNILLNNNIKYLISNVLANGERKNKITYTHGKVYKRNFLNKYKIKSKNFYSHEDLAFNLCNYFLCNNNDILKIDELTYIYNNVDNSLTKKNNDSYLLAKSYLDSYYYALVYAKKNKCEGKALQWSIQVFYDLYNIYLKRFINMSFDEKKKIDFMKMSKKFYQKYKVYIDNKIKFYDNDLQKFVILLERFM